MVVEISSTPRNYSRTYYIWLIDGLEKVYIFKVYSFTSKMLVSLYLIPLLNIAIDADNQLSLNLVVNVFK